MKFVLIVFQLNKSNKIGKPILEFLKRKLESEEI